MFVRDDHEGRLKADHGQCEQPIIIIVTVILEERKKYTLRFSSWNDQIMGNELKMEYWWKFVHNDSAM